MQVCRLPVLPRRHGRHASLVTAAFAGAQGRAASLTPAACSAALNSGGSRTGTPLDGAVEPARVIVHQAAATSRQAIAHDRQLAPALHFDGAQKLDSVTCELLIAPGNRGGSTTSIGEPWAITDHCGAQMQTRVAARSLPIHPPTTVHLAPSTRSTRNCCRIHRAQGKV